MEKEKIDRINFLARKQKAEGLTDEEKEEQAKLRNEYILEFRASFTGILDSAVIKRPDGSIEKVSQRNKNRK